MSTTGDEFDETAAGEDPLADTLADLDEELAQLLLGERAGDGRCGLVVGSHLGRTRGGGGFDNLH